MDLWRGFLSPWLKYEYIHIYIFSKNIPTYFNIVSLGVFGRDSKENYDSFLLTDDEVKLLLIQDTSCYYKIKEGGCNYCPKILCYIYEQTQKVFWGFVCFLNVLLKSVFRVHKDPFVYRWEAKCKMFLFQPAMLVCTGPTHKRNKMWECSFNTLWRTFVS